MGQKEEQREVKGTSGVKEGGGQGIEQKEKNGGDLTVWKLEWVMWGWREHGRKLGVGGENMTEAAGWETKGFERGKHKTSAVGVDSNFPKGKVITTVP